MKQHNNELFPQFNDIKSYVITKWPGANQVRGAATAQNPMSQAQTGSLKNGHITLQGVGRSFLKDRDEYLSLLHGVIACAKGSVDSCSQCPLRKPTRSTEPKTTSEQLSQQRASVQRQDLLTTEQQFGQRGSLDRKAHYTTEQQVSQEKECLSKQIYQQHPVRDEVVIVVPVSYQEFEELAIMSLGKYWSIVRTGSVLIQRLLSEEPVYY